MTGPFDNSAGAAPPRRQHSVPKYLQAHYWWAYVHPNAVNVFERQWLVNLILWGNYTRLCNALLKAHAHHLPGRTLQVACVYGNLTQRLAQCVPEGGMLDVVDVLPVQLDNLAKKLPSDAPVRLHCMNSESLGFEDRSFDRALLFFLLHEQPRQVREKTLSETLRVLRPGATLTIVDYARPIALNPLRYLWGPVLDRLEPFARDLWREDVTIWLPKGNPVTGVRRQTFFGGLYQMLTLTIGESHKD